ncbi:MAG: glycosyltransferase family 39 protein [Verrucomicrobiota bacterium]
MRRTRSPANPFNPPTPSKPAVRELLALFAVWLVVALVVSSFATRELSVPGLYYDEAVFAGQAKDFLNGRSHGDHMPGIMDVNWLGRPFPVFVQSYLGALKSWLLIPVFAVFGPSVPVLRLTTLGWGLIGLFLFMLWIRRLLGLPAALIAGPLLGLDPSYFFMTVHDWGSVALSFLCRFAGFGLLLLWWRRRKWHQLFLATFFFGLGFFNKVDFIVILLGCGLALLFTHRKEVVSAIKAAPGRFALGGSGFLLVAVPMMALAGGLILQQARDTRGDTGLAEKARIALAMYDGSYFWRLMDVGGRFEKIFEVSSAVWGPFGLVFLLASVFLVVEVTRHFRTDSRCRLLAWLLLSALFETVGFLLLPGANRIHHAMLVYPFPQLIITAALVRLWPGKPATTTDGSIRRILVVGTGLMLIAGHLFAIQRTGRLIQETGGRGWWSKALDEFCNDVKGRTDLTVVSLDWGFNEQLLFLTDGPRLSEPFWDLAPNEKLEFTLSPDTIYLIHPPEYALFPFATQILNYLQPTDDSRKIWTHAYLDRENQVAFYAIRFVPK